MIFLRGAASSVALLLSAAIFWSGPLAVAVEPTPSTRPSFSKKTIIVGRIKVEVEIADTDERRSYGLMFRESMPERTGMLFIFDGESQRAFWMKNTLIPLSIGYFDRDKILREIIDMEPAPLGTARPKSYPTRTKAMFALEMNRGWFERNKIRPGVRFRYADN